MEVISLLWQAIAIGKLIRMEGRFSYLCAHDPEPHDKVELKQIRVPREQAF